MLARCLFTNEVWKHPGFLCQEVSGQHCSTIGRLLKAVVDIQRNFLTIDSEMHSDQEEFLLEQGSRQGDLWGINIHPYATGDDWIEFDSMINIRPSWGNRGRSIEDPIIQAKVVEIVTRLVKKC